MRSFYIAILCLLASVSLAACSSRDETPTNQKAALKRPADTSSVVNSTNAVEPVNRENVAVTDGEVVPEDPIGQIKKSKMEAMRREAQNSTTPKLDVETLLKRSARPAPENSVFEVALTDVVFERRIFNDNPRLLKVEKITEGERKTIKVYLTDGKIFELQGDSVANISTEPSATFLKAAGMTMPPPSARKPNAKMVEH